MADIKISELSETTNLEGLYTIGTDRNNVSKKVSLEFVKDAANYANEQGDYAKAAGDSVNGNAGVTDYPVFSTSATYSAGDVVRYNGVLYEFTGYHSGSWNGNDVVVTSINSQAQKKIAEQGAETNVKLTELESETDVINSAIGKDSERIETSVFLDGSYIKANAQYEGVSSYAPMALTNPISINANETLIIRVCSNEAISAISRFNASGSYTPLVVGRESSWNNAEYYYYTARKSENLAISYKKDGGIEAYVIRYDIFSQLDDIEQTLSTKINEVGKRVDDVNTRVDDAFQTIDAINHKEIYFEKYNLPSGSFVKNPNEKRATAVIEVGKYNIIRVRTLKDYDVYINSYDELTDGASRINYNQDSETELYSMGKYVSITLKKHDDSAFTEVTLTALTLGLEIEIIPTSHSYNQYAYYNLEYRKDRITFQNIALYRGGLNNDTGNVFMNGRYLFSDFIAVKPTSKISISLKKDGYYAKFMFYNIDKNGYVTLIDNFTWQNINNRTGLHYVAVDALNFVDVIVPPTANAVRFELYKDDGTSILYREDVMEVFEVCGTFSSFIHNVEFLPLRFKHGIISLDSVEWVQGENSGNYLEEKKNKRCTMCGFVEVYPNQRIIFKHSNQNEVYNYAIECFGNEINSNTPIHTASLWTMNDTLIVPQNVRFIRIKVSASIITEDMCHEDMWVAVDTTGDTNRMQHSVPLWEWNRGSSYPQGLDIYNGYAFQAFADGFIDIWDIEKKELVQSVETPRAVGYEDIANHCNTLTFGEKENDSETFPILWVNSAKQGAPMLGLKVNITDEGFVFEKLFEVKTPSIDSSKYRAENQYIDFNRKFFVQISYKLEQVSIRPDGYGHAHISVFKFDDFVSGNFNLIHSFDMPIMWAMQDGKIVDGILYMLSGVGNTRGDLSGSNGAVTINIINLLEKQYSSIIDLRRFCFDIWQEPQGIAFDGLPYVSTTKGMYKLFL